MIIWLHNMQLQRKMRELAVIKADVEPEKRKSQNVRNGLVLFEVRT